MSETSTDDARIEDILHFWYDEAGEARWWKADPDFDAEIEKRFGALCTEAAAGGCAEWAESARGALALVILFDQFSRNIHRGTAAAFATDSAALDVARGAIASGLDEELKLNERYFLYMPFMHAEDPAAQQECVRLFESIGSQSGAKYARGHKRIIDRFGRYPHRNAILGRASTPEEEEYLRSGGKTF